MSLVIFCLLFSSVDYVPVKVKITDPVSLMMTFNHPSMYISACVHAGVHMCVYRHSAHIYVSTCLEREEGRRGRIDT